MGVILHVEFQSLVTTLNDTSALNARMGHWLTEHLNYFFAHYGYWTIFFGIMLESAGIPLPGETILVLASIVAANREEMNIFWIAGVAVMAAILGDNLGFAAGRYGGCRLLERYSSALHIRQESIKRGERLMDKYGGSPSFLPASLRFCGFWRGRWPVCCAWSGGDSFYSMCWARWPGCRWSARWLTSLAMNLRAS